MWALPSSIFMNRLSRRLAAWVILISSAITIVTTGAQLYYEYQRDIKLIEDEFYSLERSHFPILIKNVWIADDDLIQTQIDGLVRLPDFEYMAIKVNGDIKWESGKISSKYRISKVYPLSFNYLNKDIDIGTLVLEASIDGVLYRLWQKLLIVLFSNAIKTFIVAGFILFVFHLLVTQHLMKIAKYIYRANLSKEKEPLHLDRKKRVGDELDDVAHAINTSQKTTATAVQTLRESEERFKGLFENTEISIWNLDLSKVYTALEKIRMDGVIDLRRYLEENEQAAREINAKVRILRVNEATHRLFEAKDEREVFSQFDRIMGSKAIKVFIDELCALWNKRKVFRTEAELLTLNGKKLNVIISFQIPESINGFQSIPVNFIDVTERKQAEKQIKASLKEKEILLQEIHHRVKNNMQVISSLLKLQSDSYNDERIKKPLLESQNRVKAMAAVHENLYKSKNLSSISILPFLKELTTSILASYQLSSENITLEIDSDEIFINLEQASPLGLIVNELVSNSLKHAFTDGHKGEIHINLKRGNDDHIHLCFSDDGIGMPVSLDWRNSDSLGLKLVLNLAENQLDGSIKMEVNNGTQFDIIFREG